jgi:metal-sulfur cluster biosynthetic enzyme
MPETHVALPSEGAVREVLNSIIDPCSMGHGVPMGLNEMGLVDSVAISEHGDVHVHIKLTSPCCLMVGYFSTETLDRVAALPGVRSVEMTHDAGFDWRPDMIHPEAEHRRQLALAGVSAGRAGQDPCHT